jgi:hypothetical protein
MPGSFQIPAIPDMLAPDENTLALDLHQGCEANHPHPPEENHLLEVLAELQPVARGPSTRNSRECPVGQALCRSRTLIESRRAQCAPDSPFFCHYFSATPSHRLTYKKSDITFAQHHIPSTRRTSSLIRAFMLIVG